MSDPLGVAVVGLGLAGSVMLEAIRSHPDVRLVAAVEPAEGLRQAFEKAEGLPALAGLEQALENPSVDVVYVASPHQHHADQVVQAALSGRHVIVEKPMALRVEDCDAMVSAADDAGTVLVVGHTHGFDPGVTRLRELVQSGRYGRLGHVAAWNYTNFLYRPRRPADLDAQQGGGVVLNQVAHQVDVVRTIVARELHSVRAVTTRLDADRPVDGSCTALLEFAGGVPASLVYSGYDHFDTDELHEWVTESGTAGRPRHGEARARLQALPHSEEQERATGLAYGAVTATAAPVRSQPHFGLLVVSCEHADLRLGVDEVIAYTDEGLVTESLAAPAGLTGHAAVLDELVGAVRSGQPPLHDGSHGRETVRTCLGLLESAASGRTVFFPPLRASA